MSSPVHVSPPPADFHEIPPDFLVKALPQTATAPEPGSAAPDGPIRRESPREPSAPPHLPKFSEISNTITGGSYELDSILQMIAESAQNLTAATGAAIAMWKDGSVICRASCGEGAPPLGAHLSVESGISGHCLRSGLIQHCGETLSDPRVDAELCRHLGLRSVVVLPIRGWRGVNGILEVFSTEPRAFAEQHFDILQRLASLAERARAGQPESLSSPAASTSESSTTGILPASDRFRDLAAVVVSNKYRNLVLGSITAVGVILLVLVIWLGWRSPDETKAVVNAASTAPGQSISPSLKETDPIWKPNPGGELLNVKRSAGIPQAPQPKSSEKPAKESSSEKKSSGPDTSPDTVVRYDAPAQPAVPDNANASSDEPPLIATAGNSSALSSVLSASASTPKLNAPPVSRGLTDGYLVHRMPPVYPPQALSARLEGNVVLDALIAEDGTVHDLKVVSGQPTLARAALDAVRQWRYKPYELNRKPVKMNTTITVKFKLP